MNISVIVPAFNESSVIAMSLANLREQYPHEVIVVDGGSSDGTRVIADPFADRTIESVRGRANQMNAGAAVATGDALLFLHADCTLETDALRDAVRWLQKPWVAAGCFQMCVATPGFGYRCINAAATARVRLVGIPYGDQGLFLKRETFDAIGGFPPVRFLEDVLIGQRLRHSGRVVVSPRRIFVSDRRWRKVGLVRQTARNWAITAFAAMGVSPDRLAAHYPAVR